MILYPFAKINIGLEVLRKRSDNFHDLETIFYPLSLCDILEINESYSFKFSLSGLKIAGDQKENIVVKAYRVIQSEFNLPPVHIHLHKMIPTGAGLGGGSSDAAFTLSGLNDLFQLNLDTSRLMEFASRLGSDCPFFLLKHPAFAEGKGDIFSDINIKLKNFSLVLIKPNFSVSTKTAYSYLLPKLPEFSLKDSIKLPINRWKDRIENRFEKAIFSQYPEIGKIKEILYQKGAFFASMSGSGSSVYGLFEKKNNNLNYLFRDFFYHEEICQF
jgi:4-diphosphocytidyl-2-C-methyl-D-erythritol kinase